jgi:hypothetical protein
MTRKDYYPSFHCMLRSIQGNIRIKWKSFIVIDGMMEVKKMGNKMLMTSIDKIHLINLDIGEWHS